MVRAGPHGSVEVGSASIEHWTESIGPDLGFTAVEHSLEFSGVCVRCASDT
jgi:Fe2+ or Zn2+ uptake regulation protein